MSQGNPLVVILAGLLLASGTINGQYFDNNAPNLYSPYFDVWRDHIALPQTPELTHRIDDTFSPRTTIQHLWPNFPNKFDLKNFREIIPLFGSVEDESPDRSDGQTNINIATASNFGPNESEVGNSNNFDVETIITGANRDPSFNIFQNADPFFSSYPWFSPSVNVFPNMGPKKSPWWKGPNVCTERIETEDSEGSSEVQKIDNGPPTSLSDLAGQAAHLFGGFEVNSCIEKLNKYNCKQTMSRNGKKKTIITNKQCCFGYGRAKTSDIFTVCTKIDLKSIAETAEDMGAKEFMKNAKTNGLEEMLATNLTIFLPTDSAFTEFSEQMIENNLVVLPQIGRSKRATGQTRSFTTKDLDLNHMVDGWIDIEEVDNEQLLVTNNGNSTIRINIFPRSSSRDLNDDRYRYTANCAPIIKYNKYALNGIIHIVDRVLPPVTLSVMDIIKNRDDMTVLQTILEKTKMNQLLESDKPITIFAPTDSAFQKLDQKLRRVLKDGSGCAANIIKNHILDLTFCSLAVVADAKTTAYNILGDPMTFERTANKDNESETSEISDLTGIQEILINGQAKILETDLMGTNGVIHVIDTIMPAESGLPISILLDKSNLTKFNALFQACDLEHDLNNVTLFVPNDKAFDHTYWDGKLNSDTNKIECDDTLKEFLTYHIATPMTETCDLTEKLYDSLAGPKLRVNLYSTHAQFSNIMNRATVNCARLMHFDDKSCGSVIHQIDKVLIPPKMTLLQTLESNNNYSLFLDLIRKANLTDILEDDNSSYTLLIPKNDVFEEEEDLQNLTENSDNIKDFVSQHIVNDVICCAGIIPSNFPFVRRIETINNKYLRINRDRRPKIENAGVIKCDIIATNGIIHEINDVIEINKHSNPARPFKQFGNFGGLFDLII